jgi:transcriptional regulator with XRE-family HTH domain
VRYPDGADLGRAIREARLKQHYSQEGLADAAGMHRTYVGAIERGERNPSFRNLVRIASTLKLRLSELVAEAERLAE